MATFSQFKIKYITEKREPLRGDSLDKNIIKKLVTDPIEKNKNKIRKIDKRIQSDLNIPDDGGKGGQGKIEKELGLNDTCLLYTSPSPRDKRQSRMPSSA